MTCCRAQNNTGQAFEAGVTSLVVGVFLAGNSMSLSLATNLSDMSRLGRQTAHAVLFGVALISLWLLARPLFRKLFAERRLGLESLFCTGMLGAMVFSVHSSLFSGGAIYYELVSLLCVVYAIGEHLKATAQYKVEDALRQATLNDVGCDVVNPAGRMSHVPIDAIKVNDIVRVRPNQAIPVDGVVMSGQAFVQTASLSGEPFLRAVGPNDHVLATWFCVDATLLIRANTQGTARQIDGVATTILKHTHDNNRARALSSAERLATWFSPVVIVASCACFIFWAWRGPIDVALLNAMATLLVACPCALGFATPIGLRAAILRLAQHGIVVRDTAAIERLSHIGTLAFDKTGTLTHVALDTRHVHRGHTAQYSNVDLLGIAAASQQLIEHPIARAFAEIDVQLPHGWRALRARVLVGQGIEVIFAAPHGEVEVCMGDAQRLAVESKAWDEAGLACADERFEKSIALVIDGVLQAVLGLIDKPWVSLKALAHSAASRGLELVVLSGDGKKGVEALGLPHAQALQTAQDKHDWVVARQDMHRVCFVGDGLNDAAAMAASTASIALKNGATLAREVADFLVPEGNPMQIVRAYDCCQQTSRVIRQNLILSMSYNIIGISVAAMGLLTPVIAAILMAVSSISVSWRSMRLIHKLEDMGEVYEPKVAPQTSSCRTSMQKLRACA